MKKDLLFCKEYWNKGEASGHIIALVLFFWGGEAMYPVSDAFLKEIQSNTRNYYWTGKLKTKAGVTHEFGAADIVKGSGYITRQCCGST